MKKEDKPRTIKKSQNPELPQDESPLAHPGKTKKGIEGEEKKKGTQRIPEKGNELIR